MNLELSAEASDFGRQAGRAFETAGGDALLQQAESFPEDRAALVEPVLAGLGAWDLDPRGSADDLEAAAALCRAAGWWAVPYPLAERLARPLDLDSDGLVVVAEHRPSAPVAGLDLRWTSATLDGRRSSARALPPKGSARSNAFVTALALDHLDNDGSADVALALMLPCWTLLGMADRALQLTRTHILGREQFGQTIASFQGAQFQLTDAEVERCGLEALAHHCLWSVQSGHPSAIVDAVALRSAAIEAAEMVFRVAHQLHGAIGFCDESALSWLSRHSQPLRRLPFGLSDTRRQLAVCAERLGFSGLFSAP